MLTRPRWVAVMRPRPQRVAGPNAGGRDEKDRDGGLSLIEVLVSLILIGIAMTAFTTFFVGMISATNGQSTRQAAVQVLDGSIEQLRALKGSAVVTGRDQQSTKAQWATGLLSAPVVPRRHGLY